MFFLFLYFFTVFLVVHHHWRVFHNLCFRGYTCFNILDDHLREFLFLLKSFIKNSSTRSGKIRNPVRLFPAHWVSEKYSETTLLFVVNGSGFIICNWWFSILRQRSVPVTPKLVVLYFHLIFVFLCYQPLCYVDEANVNGRGVKTWRIKIYLKIILIFIQTPSTGVNLSFPKNMTFHSLWIDKCYLFILLQNSFIEVYTACIYNIGAYNTSGIAIDRLCSKLWLYFGKALWKQEQTSTAL